MEEAKFMDFSNSSWLEWFVAFQDPRILWRNHGTYLALEIVLYITGLLTLAHGIRNGGRYTHLWVAAILHSFNVEIITYYFPDIDNFWHAQSMTMFIGKRFPVHIMMFYPTLHYISNVAVSRLHLPYWVQPFAVGLLDPLLDVPFDIMGIKMCWWTWHDTDPNIHDRHYWVPWTSYFFHASFAFGFTTIFFGTRYLLTGRAKFEPGKWYEEWICTILTALLAMPMGVVQFVLLYHPLHDLLHIHTEVILLMLITTYAIIVWTHDRQPVPDARSVVKGRKSWFDEVALAVVVWYVFYIVMTAFFAKPDEVVATGLFERTGPCDEWIPQYTSSGLVLKKRAYLCTSDYDEQYYDFHCRPGGKPPPDGVNWYTICGTPYPNKAEYILVVTAFSVLGLLVYWNFLSRSGHLPVTPTKTLKSNKAD